MQEEHPNIEKEEHNNPVQPNQLGKGQKIAAFLLVVFAIFVVGMWSLQFRNSITQPFAYKGNLNNNTQNSALSQKGSEEDLKNKDTDEDGLSDWDELYIYKTSPYLEDSDSDGFSDKNEIDSENDPNCPTGRDCYGINSVESENVNTLNTDLINQLNLNAGTGSKSQNQDKVLQDILSGQTDATGLRQMLLDAGMEKEILDQISDEDLLKSYQETLNQ